MLFWELGLHLETVLTGQSPTDDALIDLHYFANFLTLHVNFWERHNEKLKCWSEKARVCPVTGMTGNSYTNTGNCLLTWESDVRELNIWWLQMYPKFSLIRIISPPSFPNPTHKCLSWEHGKRSVNERKNIGKYLLYLSYCNVLRKCFFMIWEFLVKIGVPRSITEDGNYYLMNFKQRIF